MQLKGSEADLPLTFEEFHERMNDIAIGGSRKIAVALSGGGDSMALACLLKQWCDSNEKKMVALIVDHGLRTASKHEAKQVGQWMTDLNVEHRILSWEGDKPSSNIQNEARSARYRLLGNWCVENRIENLFVAHHQDDQAETFLIRLFRGSGVDGLSAMDKSTPLPINAEYNVVLHRPLLDVPKARLTTYLRSVNKSWIEDPSNRQKKFTRIKVRDLLSSSSIDGLNAERMAMTADRMSRVKSLLDELTAKVESQYLSFYRLGYAVLDPVFCHEIHEELALRLLSNCLKKVSGRHYAPRLNKLENLLANLKQGDFTGQTLSGAVLFQNGDGKICICREKSAISDEINITEPKQYLWDNRFIVNAVGEQDKIVRLNGHHFPDIKQVIPDFNERLREHFKETELRDRIVPSLPCIMNSKGDVMLWDYLLSILKRSDLDGFSADFKE